MLFWSLLLYFSHIHTYVCTYLPINIRMLTTFAHIRTNTTNEMKWKRKNEKNGIKNLREYNCCVRLFICLIVLHLLLLLLLMALLALLLSVLFFSFFFLLLPLLLKYYWAGRYFSFIRLCIVFHFFVVVVRFKFETKCFYLFCVFSLSLCVCVLYISCSVFRLFIAAMLCCARKKRGWFLEYNFCCYCYCCYFNEYESKYV